MNIQRLRALRETMRTGSITGAAESLYLTQPAVSKLIAALEHELGFAIFHRQQGRLSPTDEGRLLLRRAERVLDGIDELSLIARDIREHRGRSIRLATSPQIASIVVPSAMAAFRERFPAVRVSLEVMHRKAAQWGAESGFDIGVVSLSTDAVSLPVDRVFALPAVAVVHAGHPLAQREVLCPEDLQDRELIQLSDKHALRPLIDPCFLGRNIRVARQFETSSSLVACKLAAVSQAVAIVDRLSPALCAGDPIKVLRWQPEIMLQYGVFYPPSATKDMLLEQFSDELVNSVQRLIAGTD